MKTVEITVADFYIKAPLACEEDIEYFKQVLETMCKAALKERLKK